jgi:hypothetical protein
MAAIGIVPGSSTGGWRWRVVRVQLQAAGHAVYPLTLTGLGERSHPATPDQGVAVAVGEDGLTEALPGHLT